jgi:hypothetical protein
VLSLSSRSTTAIVHDWLVTYAGAERVLREMLTLYPQADLFAVVDFLSDADRERLLGKRAQTTFIPLPDAECAGSLPAPTGVFFYEQSVAAIIAALGRFEEAGQAITPEACRENALRFAPERFRAEFTAFVEREWAAFEIR